MRVESTQRFLAGFFILALLALQGCSGNEPLARLGGAGRGGGRDNTGGSDPTGSTGGTGGSVGTGGAGAGTGTGGTGPSTPDATPPDPTQIACRAKAVTDARCAGTCHTAPPTFGAPMSLVTWQDFQQPAVKDPARKVYQASADRIHRTGAGRMPENATLSAGEMGALDAWFAAGAPAGTNCGATPIPPDSGGPRYDASLPDAPPGADCVELRAHGQQTPGDKTPFDTTQILLPGVEFYACFDFASSLERADAGPRICEPSSTTAKRCTIGSSTKARSARPMERIRISSERIPVRRSSPDGLRATTVCASPPTSVSSFRRPLGSYVLELHYSDPTLKPF